MKCIEELLLEEPLIRVWTSSHSVHDSKIWERADGRKDLCKEQITQLLSSSAGEWRAAQAAERHKRTISTSWQAQYATSARPHRCHAITITSIPRHHNCVIATQGSACSIGRRHCHFVMTTPLPSLWYCKSGNIGQKVKSTCNDKCQCQYTFSSTRKPLW